MIGWSTTKQLIRELILNDPQIAGMLAPYGDAPAFFYAKAPSDSRPGWGARKYPRVDFGIDTRQDPERKTAGTMTINIFADTEAPLIGDLDPDRAIEARLKELLSGTFYTTYWDGTICTEWERSDEFELEKEKEETHPEVYGLSMSYDILAFPPQVTTDPDPVQGLNQWTKYHFGGMTVIGHDAIPAVFRPSDRKPAVYWRFDGAVTDRQSYAVTWYNGTFHAHVIADSVVERNRWIKAITEKMQLEGEVILPDKSPMFVNRIAVRNGADPLREGQIELTGRYGVLAQQRKERAQIKLNNAPISKAKEEEG